MRPAKRIFDILASGFGLMLLVPVFVLVSLLIKLTDEGPVFFAQPRVGHMGKPFKTLKFRTMIVGAERQGQLTVGQDARITSVGRLLRRLKIDELPQLINVLRGEMSLVGPRPEVPRYVGLYTDEQRKVLELVPGITDPASIKYANESDVLASKPDPEKAYVHEIMPEKIRINLDYASKATIVTDFFTILGTFGAISRKASPGLPLSRRSGKPIGF